MTIEIFAIDYDYSLMFFAGLMEITMRNSLGPIILILLGVFMLLSNLDLLPIGKLKALVVTWWPLALVVVGVIQLKKRR